MNNIGWYVLLIMFIRNGVNKLVIIITHTHEIIKNKKQTFVNYVINDFCYNCSTKN